MTNLISEAFKTELLRELFCVGDIVTNRETQYEAYRKFKENC